MAGFMTLFLIRALNAVNKSFFPTNYIERGPLSFVTIFSLYALCDSFDLSVMVNAEVFGKMRTIETILLIIPFYSQRKLSLSHL